MEILFITHKYPPSVGGMENQSFHLIEGAAKIARVHKLVYNGQGSVWKFYLSLKNRVKSILKENPGIELVHCNDGTIGVMCSWLNQIPNIKTSVTLHGLDVVFPSKLFQNRLLRRLRKYDLIVTVSSATKEECLKRDFESTKVVCIPNGVDHDLAEMKVNPRILQDLLTKKGIDPDQNRFVVSMGRAVKRKGFSWFIEEVMPKLPDDVIYLLIGPFKSKASLGDRILKILPSSLSKNITLLFGIPTDQSAIRAQLQRDAFKSRVIPLGKLPFKDLISCVAMSDVFVMPNIKVEGDLEGFGLVALEACLTGTTVLAAKMEGIQDAIIDGKNGLLIESGNSEAWVRSVMDNIDKGPQIEARNRSFVNYAIENYSWTKMAQSYLREFENLVSPSA